MTVDRPPRAPRLDPLEVRRTLKREGLRASRARSQNFLADPDVLQSILDLAEAGPGTQVLEIGPGLGILTGGLLEAGAEVTAIELDPGLAAYLRQRFTDALEERRLTLIEGDALATLEELEEGFDVVFIDAWKDDYERIFELARQKVEPGAVIVADNVVSHASLAAYSEARQSDPTLTSVTVPVGSGLEVTTVLR